MIDSRVMILAMPQPGQAPTPELVDLAKLVQHQARYVDDLLDAVDQLIRAHMREMPADKVQAIVEAAIELQRKMAEPAKLAA